MNDETNPFAQAEDTQEDENQEQVVETDSEAVAHAGGDQSEDREEEDSDEQSEGLHDVHAGADEEDSGSEPEADELPSVQEADEVVDLQALPEDLLDAEVDKIANKQGKTYLGRCIKSKKRLFAKKP